MIQLRISLFLDELKRNDSSEISTQKLISSQLSNLLLRNVSEMLQSIRHKSLRKTLNKEFDILVLNFSDFHFTRKNFEMT